MKRLVSCGVVSMRECQSVPGALIRNQEERGEEKKTGLRRGRGGKGRKCFVNLGDTLHNLKVSGNFWLIKKEIKCQLGKASRPTTSLE